MCRLAAGLERWRLRSVCTCVSASVTLRLSANVFEDVDAFSLCLLRVVGPAASGAPAALCRSRRKPSFGQASSRQAWTCKGCSLVWSSHFCLAVLLALYVAPVGGTVLRARRPFERRSGGDKAHSACSCRVPRPLTPAYQNLSALAVARPGSARASAVPRAVPLRCVKNCQRASQRETCRLGSADDAANTTRRTRSTRTSLKGFRLAFCLPVSWVHTQFTFACPAALHSASGALHRLNTIRLVYDAYLMACSFKGRAAGREWTRRQGQVLLQSAAHMPALVTEATARTSLPCCVRHV